MGNILNIAEATNLSRFTRRLQKPDFLAKLSKFYSIYAHKYRIRILLLFLGAVISGVIEILGLLLLYYLLKILINIDSISEEHFLLQFVGFFGAHDRESLIGGIGILIASVFLLKNIYILAYYHYQHLTLRIWKNDISTNLMGKYLNAPYLFLIGYNSATIIRNINSIVSLSLNGFILSAFNFLANIIAGLIILSLLYLKYFKVTLLIGGILIVSTFLQNLFLKKKAYQLGKERDELFTEQSKNVYQGIHAIKETKVIGKEGYFLNIFKDLNFKSVNNDTKSLFFNRLPSHITEMVIILSIVVICSVVLLDDSLTKSETISSLGVLAAIAFRISPIMNRTLSALQTMNKNANSMETLFSEIEKLESQKDQVNDEHLEPLPFNQSIKFQSVAFRYPGGSRRALHEISLDIKKGEFIGVVGESGAGKTTFSDVLLGLMTPVAGEILIDDVPLTSENTRRWQKNISFVPQNIYLTDDTLRKNIAFGIDESKIDEQKIMAILKKVKLDEWISHKPKGLEFEVGENGRNVSGGQKQRIGLARALYLDCELLVLDEATSALDVSTESSISQHLENFRGAKTIVTIAHRISTVRNADRIIFFSDGRVIGFGPFQDLYNSIPEFKKMVDLSNMGVEG